MGGRTKCSVASMLANPDVFRDSPPWANLVCTAHSEARLLEQSFAVDEHSTVNPIAPQGNIILSAKDPSLIDQDLLPTICTDITPQRVEAASTPK